MQLNVVLLPDPFGPIRPRISPSFTSNETLLTARSAPKRLVRPATLSIGMEDSGSALSHPRKGRVGERSEPGWGHIAALVPTRSPSAATLPLRGRDDLTSRRRGP